MVNADLIKSPNDVKIENITLISSTGQLQTIINQTKLVRLYEDIFAPFITGYILVEDSINLINFMPLRGQEYLDIDIRTPTLPKEFCYKQRFFIYAMSDVERSSHQTYTYKLYFTSRETILDNNTKMSLPHSGRISDIVSNIISTKLKVSDNDLPKTYNVEETSNKTKFISNFWSPVKAINYCANRALNANNSPTYLFFENKHGINFVSLDTLYQLPVQYTFESNKRTSSIEKDGTVTKNISKDYNTILEYYTDDPYNYFDRIKEGYYGSEIIYYDILSQQYVHKGYGANFGDGARLNKHSPFNVTTPISPKSKLILGHQYYNNYEGYGSETSNVKTISRRQALLAQAETTKLKIVVYGRTDYSCGIKVNVQIPKYGVVQKSDSNTLDYELSGNYIISALSHNITKKEHKCVMELIKDSYIAEVDSYVQ